MKHFLPVETFNLVYIVIISAELLIYPGTEFQSRFSSALESFVVEMNFVGVKYFVKDYQKLWKVTGAKLFDCRNCVEF